MFKFDSVFYTPKEHTKGTNTCKYIILHHTGTAFWTTQWVLDWLNKRADYASCHFLVDEKWYSYKMWKPSDILRHAWESARWNIVWMNNHSMWIEIIWNNDTWFTDIEFNKVVELVKHLMKWFNIPKKNVLCHHDITRKGSKEMKLRDGKSPCRKPDISRRFWSDRWYKNFVEFRDKCL
jgi:N-acetyl-anhydromuramyl-L-alanine amidase AmpD